MPKRIKLISQLIAICIFSIFIKVSTSSAETSLAAILPLTGNAADQGEWARRGFEIAKAELQRTENLNFEILYEDSKGGDPTAAVQAYKSLKLRAKPAAVFTYGSGVGMALSPLVNSDKIIQMGIATATPKYTSPNDFTFRNFPSAALEADFIAATLDRLGFKKIAIVNIENDYGVGTAAALKSAFAARGGEISFEDSYPPGETDFKSLALKLKSSDSAAIYLASYPTDGALILRQAKQIGIDKQFLGSVAIIGGREFFQLTGDSAEGLLVASSIPAKESSFSKQYEKDYPGEAPAQQIYAARAYDALKVVAAGLSKCPDANPICIKDELFKVRNFPGASGTFSFDKNGDIDSSFAIFRIRNKAFESSM